MPFVAVAIAGANRSRSFHLDDARPIKFPSVPSVEIG